MYGLFAPLRWGDAAGRTVCRRLLDLAATDAGALHTLPGVQIGVGTGGETTLEFDGEMEIQGMVELAPSDRDSAGRMVIAAVAVARRVQR